MKKLSVLLVDSDKRYLSEFEKYISQREDMECVGCISNGADAAEVLPILQPDAVITDILLPVLDGIGFLRRVRETELAERPFILVNSGSGIPGIVKAAQEMGADYFMVKPQSFESLCDTMIAMCADDAQDDDLESLKVSKERFRLELAVTNFLHSLSMPAHLLGYKYLRSAIIHVVDDAGMLDMVTKKLYPTIAEEFSTTTSCVDRSMRNAIKVSWERGNKNTLRSVFGFTNEDSPYCPTVSEFVAMIADDIRLKRKYGKL